MEPREKMTPEQLESLRKAASNAMGDLGDITRHESRPPYHDDYHYEERRRMETPPPPSQPSQQPVQQPAGNPYIVNQAVGTVPQPNQSNGMSRTEMMRQQMRNNANQPVQAQTQQMSQGENYQPTQQQSTQQAQQQTGNRTVINTTQRGGVSNNDSDDSSGKGFKFTKKTALGLAGVVLLIVVVFIVIGSTGKKDSNTEETQPEESIAQEEELEWIIDDTPATAFVSYSDAEVEELRGLGYTGTDIENASNNKIPFRDLVKEAKAKRDAYVLETYAKILDTTTDDYKYYTSQTWLTLPKRDDINEWGQTSEYTVRKNLDYEKIDIHGNQLFIKVYLDDNLHEDWFYLNVTPEEWLALQDYGNVIVNYTYVTHWLSLTDEWGGEQIWENEDSIFITSASLEIIP